jgi:alpha,alpha-trehalose phosphorylase
VLDGALSFTDDGWTLVEDQLRTGHRSTGALFTTSNGYLGVRGPRREPFGPGACVLLAGFHETRPYAHPERSFGVPDDYQTIVPVTDPTSVAVTVDGVSVDVATGTWLEHRRSLDLRTGCVTTTGTWLPPAGSPVEIRTRRFVSLDEPGVLWHVVEVEPSDGTATVETTTVLRANAADRTSPDEPEALGRAWGRVLRPAGSVHDGDRVGLVHATVHSARAVACAAAASSTGTPVTTDVGPDEARSRSGAAAAHGRPLVVGRRIAFTDGDRADAEAVLAGAVALAAREPVAFDDALARQRASLDRFWSAATVDLEGDAETEAAVRFSIFEAFQASARKDGCSSPAKGLTGQGYEGHHLWDQEVYVGHALSLLAPESARGALEFRVRTLPAARARAELLSHRGAQYPWRTIDGREASAFMPAGAAQYHVGGDVAWAIERYVDCSGDESFLADGGLEVLVATARFWASIGRFDDDGRFVIQGVTGPDEYTALVDNNLFTNLMAARNLESAAERVEQLEAGDGAAFAALALEPDETATWRKAAAAIEVPYDDDLGVHGQDDTFLRLPRWDLEATPDDQLPLQDHHHLLTLYRHQVLKQADVVAALFLLADRFTDDERRRDFEYYEPLTTHDSSLSKPVHAIVAADVGHLELAWAYLRDTACGDLEDRYGTLDDGLHIAAAAGAWLAVVCGFGGFALRDDPPTPELGVADDGLPTTTTPSSGSDGVSGTVGARRKPLSGRPSFRPKLPPGIRRLRFRVRFRGALVEVDTDAAATTYRLLEGAALTILHHDEAVALDPGGAVTKTSDEGQRSWTAHWSSRAGRSTGS